MIKHFHLTYFRQTLFLRKSYLQILINLHIATMYQPKFIKPMLICFQCFVFNAFNKSVISCIFLSILKSSDITPVHKKSQSLKNLTIDQQVYYLTFQNFLKDACIDKFQNILKLYFRNFNVALRKFVAPKIVLATVVNCKKALDQGKEQGALRTNLSKAFDCLPHRLIVAKLHAYDFSIESLKLINSYLTGRKQRVKINHQFSSWMDILFGVAQESILGPLLFNIFLCDSFCFVRTQIL